MSQWDIEMAKVHKNLRVFYQSPDERLLAAESSPQLRTIKVRQSHDYDKRGLPAVHTFYLSFPYMQFYLSKDRKLFLTFSKKPVLNVKKNKVHFPFLPNVYSQDSKVCLGVHPIEGFPTEEDVEKAIGKFWNTSFYLDLGWFGSWSIPVGIRKIELDFEYYESGEEATFETEVIEQFRAWEKGTRKKGVDFISKLRWPCPFYNLSNFLTGSPRRAALSIKNKELDYAHRYCCGEIG